MVGFAPYDDLNCISSQGVGVTNVADFVQSFEHHVIASICENNYAATMQAAVDEIKSSCDEFIPPD